MTVDKWLEGSRPFQIVHQFNLLRRTVTNIVDRFICPGSPYTEFFKQRQPSMYVVVQFYPWFKFYFPLFLGRVMYDNEFETKGNKF